MEYNPSLTPAYLAGKVDEYVKFAARDTIKRNAKRDRNARFARIPDGEACDFCRMLGSRGFVYHSEKTAGGDSHGTEKDPYHPFCNCQIAVCFDPFIEEYYKGWTKVTRGYGDGEVVVTGRDGSDVLREADIDELYEEYRAMLQDFNRGKRSSKYKDYTLGAKLTDEQFDAAMKRLAEARTREELHEVADDIVANWPANSNGRFKRQWDEMSKFAKARDEELGSGLLSSGAHRISDEWFKQFPDEEMWVECLNGDKFHKKGTPRSVELTELEANAVKGGKAQHTHTTSIGGTFGEDDIRTTGRLWFSEHEVIDVHNGVVYRLIRNEEATPESAKDFFFAYLVFSSEKLAKIERDIAKRDNVARDAQLTDAQLVEAETKLKVHQHKWLDIHASEYGYKYEVE